MAYVTFQVYSSSFSECSFQLEFWLLENLPFPLLPSLPPLSTSVLYNQVCKLYTEIILPTIETKTLGKQKHKIQSIMHMHL